ncbi:MAG: acyl-CoA reductase, partial [Bacteroidia bacterium]|nr:acyl-CoA reductase [Bacteroidia bacterium]
MNKEIKKRVKAFSELANFIENHLNGIKIPGLENFHTELDDIIEKNFHYNGWFAPQSTKIALSGIVSMLNEKDLNAFAENIVEEKERRVAVIMAGNIPAVGFHDLLCVLLSGHKIIIKPSSDDHLLIPFFTKLLIHFEPALSAKIYFAEAKLTNFDAVIATGNNNSSRYFEYYFGKYPHIIRKNRNSIAILSGNETKAELSLLAKDIFTFFGLGCRNVSKIYAPDG